MNETELGRVLGERLNAITAGLEPRDVAVDPVRPRHGRVAPAWTTAAAFGLVAATVVALVAWTGRDPDTKVVVPAGDTTAATAAATAPTTTSPTGPISPTSVAPTAVAAQNYLIVGVDGGGCDAPGADRSDTIIVLRVEPSLHRAEMLSFQRDLWVDIAGTNASSRLNSAYVRDDPTKLIFTLMTNFGVPVDHFVQLDFCAFSTIVDAIGGVSVPFDRPVRDTHTGLAIASPGCVRLDGSTALAYVRSRHLEELADDGTWHEDPRSDLSRIDRQQDFVRRTLDAVLAEGLADPTVLQSLLTAVQDQIVVDDGLTLARLLDLAGSLAALDAPIAGFQLPVSGRTVAGQSVLVASVDDPAAQAILAVFRGTEPGDPSAPSTSTAPPAVDTLPATAIVPDAAMTCEP